MLCIYTEVMAQDETVTFESNPDSFSALLTSPNYAFMRCRLYSKRKVLKYNSDNNKRQTDG